MAIGTKPTIPITPLTQGEVATGKKYKQHRRPKTRAECVAVPRPCPFIGCVHHLYLDKTKTGRLIVNFPDQDVLDLKHSCVLDVVDQYGPMRLNEIGTILNVTQERVRQIVSTALKKARPADIAEERETGRAQKAQIKSNVKVSGRGDEQHSVNAIHLFKCSRELLDTLTFSETQVTPDYNTFLYGGFIILCALFNLPVEETLKSSKWWRVPALLTEHTTDILCVMPYNAEEAYLIASGKAPLQNRVQLIRTLTLSNHETV
jgi:hypothetical protein